MGECVRQGGRAEDTITNVVGEEALRLPDLAPDTHQLNGYCRSIADNFK